MSTSGSLTICRKRASISSSRLARQTAHVHLRFCGIGDHVDLETGTQHGRDHGGVQHRVDFRIVRADLIRGCLRRRRIVEPPPDRIEPGVFGQLRKIAQIAPRGGVHMDRLLGFGTISPAPPTDAAPDCRCAAARRVRRRPLAVRTMRVGIFSVVWTLKTLDHPWSRGCIRLRSARIRRRSSDQAMLGHPLDSASIRLLRRLQKAE